MLSIFGKAPTKKSGLVTVLPSETQNTYVDMINMHDNFYIEKKNNSNKLKSFKNREEAREVAEIPYLTQEIPCPDFPS